MFGFRVLYPTFAVRINEEGPNPTGGVCALFIRRSDHSSSGIVYESLFSADLASWEAPGVTTTVLADDNTHQVVRVDFPALLTGGTTPRFFALKVTSSP